ncbi:MAG: cell division protein FtsL [Pseudomonadota bacterium]
MLVKVSEWLESQQAHAKQRHWILFFALLTGITSTSLGVVFTTYTTRHLLNDLQQLVHEQNQLQVEWGQLLLEQSSLVAQGQIEEIAISQLGMQVPAMDKVVVFTGD